MRLPFPPSRFIHNRRFFTLVLLLLVVSCQRFSIAQQSPDSANNTHASYESLRSLDQLIRNAENNGDSALLSGLYQKKGSIECTNGNMQDAIRDELRSFGIAERNKFPTILKRSSSVLNRAYTYQGEYGKAITYGLRAFELFNKAGNQEETSESLIAIGQVYYKIENVERAIGYYKQALAIKRTIKSKNNLDLLLVDISLCYAQLKDFVTARGYLEESRRVCNESCSDKLLVLQEFADGYILFQAGDFMKATPHFQASYELSKKNSDKQHQLQNLLHLGEISIQTHHYDQAKQYLSEAENFVDNGYNEENLHLFRVEADLYDKLADFENQSAALEKIATLRDSLYGLTMTKRMLTVQAEFEQRENKSKIKAQNELLVLQDEVIGKQRTLMIAAIIPGLLLLAIAVLLYIQVRQKRHANQRLEERIQARSRELERNFEIAKQRNAHQTNVFGKTISDLRSQFLTLRGLGMLLSTSEGLNADNKNRVKRILEASQSISDIFKRFS